MDNQQRSDLRGCLSALFAGAGGILFIMSLIGFFAVSCDDDSLYRVEFGEPGNSCSQGAMGIDTSTGEELSCDAPFSSTGEFSGPERKRLLWLSKQLADDDGLDSFDREQIQDLAEQISAEHGSPVVEEAIPPYVLLLTAVLGLVLFLVMRHLLRRKR